MKETEQISVGGYAFVLERDASEALRRYINELEAHYLSQEGGKEIMEGIEERVAELLLDKCGKNGVGTIDHVQAVIDIVGRPERIEADDPTEQAAPESGKGRKKLFRDEENKRLGGVCSGLATFFNVDVAWLRMGFIVLTLITFFSGKHTGSWSMSIPLVYAILWVSMPAARTAQDRWAMKGDSGTADEIRRNVQAGIREMGDTARDVTRSSAFKQIGRIFLVIIGFAFLVVGTSGLASISVFSLKGIDWFGVPYARFMEEVNEHAPFLMDMLSTDWVVALLALAVILPFVGILYGGIQLIFGFKSPNWKPGLVIFVFWLIIVIVLLVMALIGAASAGYTFA